VQGLNDKVFIVTGGGSGIGAVTALRLLAEGARVVAAGTRAEGLAQTHAAAGQAADRLLTVQFDLRDEASTASMVSRTIETFGRLDGVANVAAALTPELAKRDQGVDTMDTGLWTEVLQTNLIGTAVVIRETLPALVAAGGGSIVNVSSGAVWMGAPANTAYSSAKLGLHALTRHTAQAWGGKSVRCNTLAPSLILTERGLEFMPEESHKALLDLIALPRLGRPEDVASAVTFLLSDDSRWITGQTISVDGGMIMR
jgi:NAD(P)-dependent dehydrogenase (short-subunit alcohol dehydrogenase family)